MRIQARKNKTKNKKQNYSEGGVWWSGSDQADAGNGLVVTGRRWTADWAGENIENEGDVDEEDEEANEASGEEEIDDEGEDWKGEAIEDDKTIWSYRLIMGCIWKSTDWCE